MVHYKLAKQKQSKRIRFFTMRHGHCLILVCLLAVSCSVTTTPVPTKSTVNSGAEILVASTFTPSPSASPEHATVEPETADLPAVFPSGTPEPSEETDNNVQDIIAQVTVTAGDTLINIALQYELPMAAIQLVNKMEDSTVVRVGQVLDIPRPEDWKDASPYWVVYVVQVGESISKIGAKYGLSVTEIVKANNFEEADLITVGQSIILPLDGPAKIASVAQAPLVTTETPTTTLPSPTPEPTVVLMNTPTPPPSSPATSVPQPPPEFTGDTATLRVEIFRLLNEQRAIYGRVPLTWNDILASAAQKHADDCYARGWCGHTGSDGSSMKTRIIREGYDPTRWSECWAWYGTPAKAVEMWMDEVPPDDAHRRTILSPYLTEVGVGVMPGNGHGYYFIADFGTPRQ